MANISLVIRQLATGGDLPLHLGADAMRVHLTEIQAAGVTHIIDNRIEWPVHQGVDRRPSRVRRPGLRRAADRSSSGFRVLTRIASTPTPRKLSSPW